MGDLWSAISQIPAGELSEAEKEGILYMREEEKLARDVHLKLYEIWGLQIFRNIADSEQTHMDAVKLLISRYRKILATKIDFLSLAPLARDFSAITLDS